MLAMYMNSTSIGYGSPLRRVGDHHVHQPVRGERRIPAEGLVDTLRRARGIDQQVLGSGREAELRTRQRLHRLDVARLAARLEERRRLLRVGRLVAEAAGQSIEPSRICRMCRMRQVWKPFEWAEMPRMACMPTGRPIILSWRRPVQSVHGMSSTTSSLKAACASSAAMRRMLAAATPVSFSTFSGAYSADEEPLRQQLEHRHRLAAVGEREGARQRRAAVGAVSASTSLPDACRSASGLPVGIAREQAVVGGAGIADHQPRHVGVAHQVVEIDRSARLNSSWISAATNSPSVPGLMPIHSSAIGVVAGAHRVDRHHLDAALLELAERRS